MDTVVTYPSVQTLRDAAIRDAWREVRRLAQQRPRDECALFLAEMYAEMLEAERVNS